MLFNLMPLLPIIIIIGVVFVATVVAGILDGIEKYKRRYP